jgi:REP element-mobilizing transposase RayT
MRCDAVLEAIHEVCSHRGWSLLAAHVRSNHVHTVVEAEAPPERIMNGFKVYASRRLNWMEMDEPRRRRWARTREHALVVETERLSAAMQYVVNEQRQPMSAFESHQS